ncbi:hypothetical protein K474DRAFT_57056 [Panus rudis PR-1116 ss-1]|nr:hypothetical protein K474DRAFT_57056 [Panus rudis PR-1116 ss-1]
MNSSTGTVAWKPCDLLTRGNPHPSDKLSCSRATFTKRVSVVQSDNTADFPAQYTYSAKYISLLRRRTPIVVEPFESEDETLRSFSEKEIVNPLISYVNCLRRSPADDPYISHVTKAASNDSNSVVRTDIWFQLDNKPDAKYYGTLKWPTLVFLPPGSLARDDTNEKMWNALFKNDTECHFFMEAVRRIIEVPVTVTDFNHVLCVTKVNENIEGSIIPISPELSVSLLMGGCLLDAIPEWVFGPNEVPRPIPQGALDDPCKPSPTDEEIIATRHSHSDFDRFALMNKDAIRQFLRWKQRMQETPRPAMEGNSISVLTYGFEKERIPFEPRYALEPLPEETLKHMEATKRPTYPEFDSLLKASKSFEIVIDKELTPKTGLGYARTFSCRVTTIDGKEVGVSSPGQFVAKVFDDSVGKVDTLEGVGGFPESWIQGFRTSQEMIQCEEDVYNRLQHAWASVIPWFYGVHRFTFPDGTQRYGILLEYIPKATHKLREHSSEAQRSFIRAARHALRVLQYADITQRDWTDEQFIPSPYGSADRPLLNCVLIDFSNAFQSDRYYDIERKDDYGEMSYAILLDLDPEQGEVPPEERDGCPEELIREEFGPREEWDNWRDSYLDE